MSEKQIGEAAKRPVSEPHVHALKTWPAYFGDVFNGSKQFEVRRADRPFKVGDVLRLREFDPRNGYTGRECRRYVTYLLPGGEFGIEDGFCVMGLAE